MSTQREVSLPAGFIRTLAEATTRQEVLDATSIWMPRIINAERSSIATPLNGTMMEITAIGGRSAILAGAQLPIANSMVGQVFLSGEMLIVDDLTATDGAESASLLKAGLRSTVVAPIVSHGRCLGTINLGNRQTSFFRENDCERLRSVGLLVGSFLHVYDLAEAAQAAADGDDLTQVLARNAILKRLEDGFASSDSGLELIFIDLDGFKAVNDAHGHRVGDRVLQILTQRMQTPLKGGESLGRLGGDEFLIVVQDQPHGRAIELSQELLHCCTQTVSVGHIRISPGLSIGVATRDDLTPSADYLLGSADQAMYAAKNSDRTIVVADDAIRQRVALIMMMDRELDAAMNSGAMHFAYQPVRDAITGELLGAEALLRWHHPDFGPISPPLIVDRIESTGRTHQFTEWTLQRTAGDLADVRRKIPAFADKAFAINLTPHQLGWDGYYEHHIAACEKFGIRVNDLIIEVVECEAIAPGDPAETTLRAVAEAGATIALDDFGAGHNGLRYFARFPIHALKFDRSLISTTATTPTTRTILSNLAAMCEELGVVALAEGVETEEEHVRCVEAGIRHGQGWYFGRPMRLDKFIDIARSELTYVISPTGAGEPNR